MNAQNYDPKHLHKMTPMWLFPYLVEGDALFGTGRWQYWADTLLNVQIPDDPIPPLEVTGRPDRETVKHLATIIDYGQRHSGQRHAEVFEQFVVWLLHGLGDPEFKPYATPDLIPGFRVPIPVLDDWYEKFELGRLQQHPHDYLAFFAQGGANKGYNPYEGYGFFATPLEVCRLMASMTFSGVDAQEAKRMSVCDPCCGTGGLLLAASNYSLNLYGVDISLAMVRFCKLNAWLYMPWLVFWPDFSLGGWPPERMRHYLFGQSVRGVTPNPETIPPQPPQEHILRGELKQTVNGQYILPLFDELVET